MKPWTTTELTRMRHLIGAGMTQQQVAMRLRRTLIAVKHQCLIAGVRCARKIRWTADEDARLLEMLHAGQSIHAMTREFGKSERAVRGRLSTLGGGFRERAIAA